MTKLTYEIIFCFLLYSAHNQIFIHERCQKHRKEQNKHFPSKYNVFNSYVIETVNIIKSKYVYKC